MTLLTFLAEWALRSALIMTAAGVLLKVFRVHNPSIRLAAWIMVLLGSFAMPVLSPVLPTLSVPLTIALPPSDSVARVAEIARPVRSSALAGLPVTTPTPVSKSFEWASVAAVIYLMGAIALLLRLFTGLTISRRLIARSISTGRRSATGTAIHESTEMAAPATLGVSSPVLLLPAGWRDWGPVKLQSILAHEDSHIRRRDPALQFLSAIHRSLLWYSPASWLLHTQLVRVAEEASDDAALAATADRVTYAEVLLQFMQQAASPVRWEGVAMARYGSADARIHRILDGTRISRGLTPLGWTATIVLAAPLVYLAAAVHPTSPSTAHGLPATARMPAMAAAFLPNEASSATASAANASSAPATASAAPAETDAQDSHRDRTRYLIVTGDSTSGMFDSRDHLPLDAWRSRFGAHFVWFRQDGTEYIVTDQSVLGDLNVAMAPQRTVNLMQGEVNRQQSEVNRHQGIVNEDQGRVNTQQGEVNRMQSDVNARERRGQSDRDAQTKVNEAQAEVNRQQKIVNREQDDVNQEQSVVNGEQAKVNAEQRRISPVVEAAIQGILDASVLKGLAHGIAR